jgi:hypothetical protein
MAVLRAMDATAVHDVVARKGAMARLLATFDSRGALYPVLTARAALDGGHRCVPGCICVMVGQ